MKIHYRSLHSLTIEIYEFKNDIAPQIKEEIRDKRTHILLRSDPLWNGKSKPKTMVFNNYKTLKIAKLSILLTFNKILASNQISAHVNYVKLVLPM